VSGPPDDLAPLDRALDAVRFAPRASLGPEIEGRARRGESPRVRGRPSRRRMLVIGLVAAGVGAVALAIPALTARTEVTVDRCCWDLDGGGEADDGVRVVARRDADVRRLWIYEDADHSGGLTSADVVRLERGATPALAVAGVPGLVARERCCLDFDGGGPADDGLLVIGAPPDRVVMAAIFERTTRPATRLPLR
jgi:hypothetical protein